MLPLREIGCEGKRGSMKRSGFSRGSIWLLLIWMMVPTGCGSAPSRAPAGQTVEVLRAKGMIYQSRPGDTLNGIARDRGFDLKVLEALNPRWKGIKIRVGSEIRFPVGKPKIRRIQTGSKGNR